MVKMIIGEETAYADIRILKRREKVKQKRHFIVSTLELQIYFQIFQNKKKGGVSTQPKAADPDAQWSKRQWEKAMANCRSELRRWMEEKATKKGHGRHTLMPEPHSNVASLSVALNARNAMANCPNIVSWWLADTELHWERRRERPSVRS